MEKLSAKSYQPKAKIIGIDASRAFAGERTGIEEYAYQTIKHLRGVIPETDAVVLYVRKKSEITQSLVDFSLPANWRVCALWAPRFWTYARLSIELFLHPVDVLFVPSHVVPPVHPQHTVVTIHGIEYEHQPHAYTWWERFSMRFAIRRSCAWASHIIAVSRATRDDLVRNYHVKGEKISVIHEGVDDDFTSQTRLQGRGGSHSISVIASSKPYALFIGRIERRKNIAKIIEAFEIVKEKHHLPHALVLVGKPGHGYDDIKFKIRNSRYKDDIIETGYVSEERKRALLRGAGVFLFPTLAEGFGLPILEAQAQGVPVIASRIPSHEEIAVFGGEETVLFVAPRDAAEIADRMYRALADETLRSGIIQKGYANCRRFTWSSSARAVASLLA